MLVASWSCNLPDGRTSEELAVQFDQARQVRLLVIPALFDEANKLRRQTIEVMRRLDLSGIDSFLPDLPGTNESLVPLGELNLHSWREAARAAANHFGATHFLTWRGGAMLAPDNLPGWQYAPLNGAKQLRSMLRARTITAREAGREEKTADLQETARTDGIELVGWRLGAEMFADLESAETKTADQQVEIPHAQIGGTGLWLRAEPDENPEQADALAGMITIALDDLESAE